MKHFPELNIHEGPEYEKNVNWGIKINMEQTPKTPKLSKQNMNLTPKYGVVEGVYPMKVVYTRQKRKYPVTLLILILKCTLYCYSYVG